MAAMPIYGINALKIFFSGTCSPISTKARKLNMQVDDICLQNVSTQKVLGLNIDEHLTWKTHIDHLCSAISSKISLLIFLKVKVCAQ